MFSCKDVTHSNVAFQLLEENIAAFMKKELKKYRKILDFGSQHGSGVWKEEDCDEEQMGSAGDAFLEISQIFLRRMKQAELAEYLQSGKFL